MRKILATLILTGFASTSLATEFKRPGSIPKSAAPAERTQTYRVPGPVAASLAYRWGLIGTTEALRTGMGTRRGIDRIKKATFEATGTFSGYCALGPGNTRDRCLVLVFGSSRCVDSRSNRPLSRLNDGWEVEDIRISGTPMRWKKRPWTTRRYKDCLAATFEVPVTRNQRHNFSIQEVILKGPAGKSIEDAFRR